MFHNHITCEGKDAGIDEMTLHVQNAFGWNARSGLIEREIQSSAMNQST